MIYYIMVLRALAACLITNSHYEGIYPTNIIANGGLIGDILFFAVSGFCLCNIKYELSLGGFASWYGKRLRRVYPPVIVCTMVYMLLGAYNVSIDTAFWWFIYPTNYHFVASIVLLYIPFFFSMKIEPIRRHVVGVMLGIAVVWIGIYTFAYEKTYYHIDSVYEPMIRILFFESMLMGAWFRINDKTLRNNRSALYPIAVTILAVLYFAIKMLFSKGILSSQYQFVNQVLVFVLLYFILRLFSGLDSKLEQLPEYIKRAIGFISKLTLEIYVVQYVLIGFVREAQLPFPMSWFVATASIIGAAYVLNKACSLLPASIGKKAGTQIST